MLDMPNNNNPSLVSNPVILKPRREIVIEDLQAEMDKQLDKIAVINDFMALHCERKLIKEDLVQLKDRTAELKQLLAAAREKIRIFKTVERADAETLIENMRRQHLAMLNKLDELDNSENDSRSSSGQSCTSITGQDENRSTPMSVTPKQNNRQTFTVVPKMNTITPKRHQSPFGLRVNPRALCKLNQQFQIQIDSNDFDRIPKYMKGRDSIDELTTFLDTVIIKCFINKYTLLHRDRENVQPGEMTRWQMYRTQMEYFPGEMFITEGDISTLLGRMMDKKMCNRIAMLRHLHVIQDVRRGMATCYIWKGKK